MAGGDILRSRFGLVRVECLHTAVSSVFHGGWEKTGSVQLLRRLKFTLPDGRLVDVPVVSGNSVRGYLRRLVFRDFLERVGYEIPVETRAGRRLFHTLFAGGVLEAREGEHGVVDLDLKRRIYELLPPARLWGLSILNQALEGKLLVGPMIPVARETAAFLPEHDAKLASRSVFELVAVEHLTRRDEVRERGEGEKPVQMIVEYEVFAPGTVFHQELVVEDPAPIDEAVLRRALELWRERPYVGGRSASGHGRLRVGCSDGHLAPSRVYLDYIEANRDRIRAFLDELLDALR